MPDGLGTKRNVVFCELSHRLGANLRPVAANHYVGDPVLHHDGKLPPFISLAICSYRLAGIFEPVTVKTMMHGNPVERFDTGEFGDLVNQPRRKKDFRSTASRAVRTDKLESFSGAADDRDPCAAHRDGPVAREVFPRFVQK
jgi:hypothetical protein